MKIKYNIGGYQDPSQDSVSDTQQQPTSQNLYASKQKDYSDRINQMRKIAGDESFLDKPQPAASPVGTPSVEVPAAQPATPAPQLAPTMPEATPAAAPAAPVAQPTTTDATPSNNTGDLTFAEKIAAIGKGIGKDVVGGAKSLYDATSTLGEGLTPFEQLKAIAVGVAGDTKDLAVEYGKGIGEVQKIPQNLLKLDLAAAKDNLNNILDTKLLGSDKNNQLMSKSVGQVAARVNTVTQPWENLMKKAGFDTTMSVNTKIGQDEGGTSALPKSGYKMLTAFWDAIMNPSRMVSGVDPVALKDALTMDGWRNGTQNKYESAATAALTALTLKGQIAAGFKKVPGLLEDAGKGLLKMKIDPVVDKALKTNPYAEPLFDATTKEIANMTGKQTAGEFEKTMNSVKTNVLKPKTEALKATEIESPIRKSDFLETVGEVLKEKNLRLNITKNGPTIVNFKALDGMMNSDIRDALNSKLSTSKGNILFGEDSIFPEKGIKTGKDAMDVSSKLRDMSKYDSIKGDNQEAQLLIGKIQQALQAKFQKNIPGFKDRLESYKQAEEAQGLMQDAFQTVYNARFSNSAGKIKIGIPEVGVDIPGKSSLSNIKKSIEGDKVGFAGKAAEKVGQAVQLGVLQSNVKPTQEQIDQKNQEDQEVMTSFFPKPPQMTDEDMKLYQMAGN